MNPGEGRGGEMLPYRPREVNVLNTVELCDTVLQGALVEGVAVGGGVLGRVGGVGRREGVEGVRSLSNISC